ncbi:MAG TPA: YqaE/Pmp3 family membrane protein [Bacteroidia bacterium]|nr:YqaE/Pmp3 family membrane protein [Bacteroidia bacterium]HQW23460.1 YqaE/Pmp3 family membrane protein [Bacteroidia bacterium]
MILFAILLPPLAVGLKFGIGTEFWISVLLTLLFWIPGVIYALILILD